LKNVTPSESRETPSGNSHSHSEPPRRPNIFPTHLALPVDEGPHIGISSLLLSLPSTVIVGVVCVLLKPGFLISVAATSFTSAAVFAAVFATVRRAKLIQKRKQSVSRSSVDPSETPQDFSGSSKETPMQLVRLIYASSHSNTPIGTIDRILQRSRENNGRDVITGALVVGDDFFLQVLEGSRAAVSNCFMRIMQDDRHREIQVISVADIKDRNFLEWTMHFIRASRIKEEILSRYHINGGFDPAKLSERAIRDLCRTLSRDGWEKQAA